MDMPCLIGLWKTYTVVFLFVQGLLENIIKEMKYVKSHKSNFLLAVR